MQTKTLAQVIREHIAKSRGILRFDRFMDLALYCPNLGYYETNKDRVGRGGDFYTSVSTGSLFGELLAFQFAEWLTALKIGNSRLKIIEAGAHDGQLAHDILTWFQTNRPDLFERLEYGLYEKSSSRREWQTKTLEKFANRIDWNADLDTPARINGIIFSNEFLDAFAVNRYGWDAGQKKWFEWGVATDGDNFAWAKIPRDEGLFASLKLPIALLDVLPDNYTIEFSSSAGLWWTHAARSLHTGKLMTIDYGYIEDEKFLPARRDGTLRAFFKHHFADDLLANPGEQDLTADVDFTAIQRAGELADLKTDSFCMQSKFLTQILEKTVKDKTFGEWTPARTRQFQTLTHPEHLGRAFHVLVQSK